ncbi:hypothetical protein MLF85_007600 [Escherichia coli]|nr:hypothetical protein [Escherichia coli]MCV0679508.1 hypothetical protein [Escherichia coli]MCV1746550.1 hypothetical protein [Escherichia coli]MCV1821815.1 hypothetical protein [Escherichia coli]
MVLNVVLAGDFDCVHRP